MASASHAGAALAEQRAHLEQILERDRVVVRRALVVAAVFEHLLGHLRLEQRERLRPRAHQLVREHEADGVAQQVIRADVPLEVLAQEQAVQRDGARDEAAVCGRRARARARAAARDQFTSRVATARAFQLSRAKPGRPIVASALQLRISARQRSR